jgi:hypothetical protein
MYVQSFRPFEIQIPSNRGGGRSAGEGDGGVDMTPLVIAHHDDFFRTLLLAFMAYGSLGGSAQVREMQQQSPGTC